MLIWVLALWGRLAGRPFGTVSLFGYQHPRERGRDDYLAVALRLQPGGFCIRGSRRAVHSVPVSHRPVSGGDVRGAVVTNEQDTPKP